MYFFHLALNYVVFVLYSFILPFTLENLYKVMLISFWFFQHSFFNLPTTFT